MVKKVKKMAVGGTVESKKFYKGYRLKDGKPVVFSRKGLIGGIQAREIDDAELYKKALIKRHNDTNYENQLMKAVGEAGLKKVLKMLDREIDAKKAGMAATSIYPFENPIPTLQGTVQDKKTKKETDKYLKKKRAKGRNKTRMKKGGVVKAHRGDGIAKRGRTRGRIV